MLARAGEVISRECDWVHHLAQSSLSKLRHGDIRSGAKRGEMAPNAGIDLVLAFGLVVAMTVIVLDYFPAQNSMAVA